MNENVVPIKTVEQFELFRGFVDKSGSVVETDRVGFAYLKPRAKMYSLRLWMFTKEQYFLAHDESSSGKYAVLSIDEYRSSSGEMKTFWNKVGDGFLHGNFVRIKFHLLAEEVFLCLFRAQAESEAMSAA